MLQRRGGFVLVSILCVYFCLCFIGGSDSIGAHGRLARPVLISVYLLSVA